MNPSPAAPHPAGFARRFLVALVGAVCRRPRTVLAVSFALCALSAYAAFFHLHYLTQRDDLLSPTKDYQKRFKKYRAVLGDDADLVVVVRGDDPERLKAALENVAGKVSAQPQLFDRLFYKVDLRHLRDRALMLLPTSDIEAIRKNLDDMGPLLEPPVEAKLPGLPEIGFNRWQALTLLGLTTEASRRLETDKPLTAADEQMLTQLVAVLRNARAVLDDPQAYKNPWGSLMKRPDGEKDQLAEPQYFFSGDGRLAFLLARPVKERGSFTPALKSVTAMRSVVAAARAESPEVEIGLTGLPVLENDEMAAAQSDSQLASWLALAGVSILFLIVYRGVAYPLLTIVTLGVGTAWALGWLTLTVGHLNILSATFAVMLIGMGDYGVLWVMRYDQARKQGMEVRESLLHTTAHMAVGNLTAATTLALAFFAAFLADFRAVAELGWIAGCGVLLCALACFTVLPALLMVFDRRTLSALAPSHVLPTPFVSDGVWLPWLTRRPRWVVAGGLAVTAVLAACACRVSYDHNLLHLQAQDLESVRWQRMLIDHTAGATWHALSIADGPADALEMKARFEKLPEVSRVVEVATLVPPDQDEKLPLLADIRERLKHLPPRGQRIEHVEPDVLTLTDALRDLINQLPQSPGAGLLDDLRAATVALWDRLPIHYINFNDPDHKFPSDSQEARQERRAAACVKGFEEQLAGDLAEDLHRLDDVSTPKRIALDDLPAALRERHVSPGGKWLLRVFGKEDADHSLWDFGPLEHFTEAVRTVDPKATGKPFGTVEGLRAMKDGLMRAGFYAFLVIVAVLLIDFRNGKNTLIALAPLLMGVTMALGVLGLCGVPLNPANMIAFPLILGVGVDNGVHLLHDWLIRRAEGRSSISHAIGRGVLVKALTSMIGFSTLMISSERGLAGLGLLLTLGVGCSMLASLLFLPAVLALRGRQSGSPVQTTSTDREPLRTAA
jgi:hopanoid biosynthesis associated RND transporter like protein HpnN